MKYLAIVIAISCTFAYAVEVPEAPAEFRSQQVKKYLSTCIKAIDDDPDLRTNFSRETVQVWCNCSERYQADMVWQARKEGRRG
jgi:hypothetical protein